MEDHGVAVEVAKGGEVAYPGVPSLGDEGDAFRFELSASSGDIGDSHGKSRLVGDKRQAVAFGFPETQRDVRCLDFTVRYIALRQAEHVAVPRHCPRNIPRRNRDEVDLLDAHAPTL